MPRTTARLCRGVRSARMAPTLFRVTEARERIRRADSSARIVCTFRNLWIAGFAVPAEAAYGFIPMEFEEALERDPEFDGVGPLFRPSQGMAEDIWVMRQVMVTMHDDMQADPQGLSGPGGDFIGVPRWRWLRSTCAVLLPRHDRAAELLPTRGAICCRSGRGHGGWTRWSLQRRSGDTQTFCPVRSTFPEIPRCSARSCANSSGPT